VPAHPLVDALHALTSASAAPEALDRLAAVLVPALGDWCVADVLEPPDLVTRVAARGLDGTLSLPRAAGSVGARRSSAAARGVLQRLVEVPGRMMRLTPDDLQRMTSSPEPRTRGQGELALALGTVDLLVLGLTSQDALLAVLAVGRTGRPFSAAEVAELVDVAAVAALAVDALRLRGVQRSVSTALQQSLLPALPLQPGVTLTARFVPAGSGLAVGGDWYDVFVLPSSALALVIGDATGHDVQAAARMAELRSLLRALAVDRAGRPAQVLERLDQVLAQLAPELSGTCLYAQLSGGSSPRTLRWSSAGHLPPLLLRDGVARTLETTPELMLGVRAGTGRSDHVQVLRPGDLVVLHTDGLVEQRSTGLDTRLQDLRHLVEAVGGEDPELLADRLVGELASGEDDVALLLLQVGD
jgi:serine phosphatase RsbU (regulator of sigma subunit)